MIDRNYLLLGNAIITIHNTKTGNRFTYHIRKPSANSPHFVKVLAGPDNTTHYSFLGSIFDETNFRHGKKSTISYNAQSAKVFRWLWKHIDNLPECVELNHEGYCGVCGKILTTPESVTSGIGPTCKMKLENGKRQ